MEIPTIQINTIIRIGNGLLPPKAQIVRIYTEEEKKLGLCGDVEVVYHQNGLKGIKEDAVWDGDYWQFRQNGPGGSYVDINQYPDVKVK